MIVVAGPVRGTARGDRFTGFAFDVARSAVAAGRDVQLVCRVPSGRQGDAIVLALGRAGIGHAAVLRDAVSAGAPVLGPADLELALRYVTTFSVLVLAEPGRPDLVPVAAESSAFAGARLVVLDARGGPERAWEVAHDVTVLEAPRRDPDGAFAAVVAGYAAALDAGADPVAAWEAVAGSLGLSPAAR